MGLILLSNAAGLLTEVIFLELDEHEEVSRVVCGER